MPGQIMREFDLGGIARRRSLDGVMILLVEDSLSASEAMRLMALSCGARLRRADNIENALALLKMYPPHVAIVDLGLPDGNGIELIRTLSENGDPAPGIVAISGADSAEWEGRAHDAGAQVMITKPVAGIEGFQDAILACLPDREEREGFRRATRVPESDGEAIDRDLSVISDLLAHAAEDEDAAALRYGGRFLEGLARALDHSEMRTDARKLYDKDLPLATRVDLARDLRKMITELPSHADKQGR